jgi:hypothetical protein
MSNAGIPLRVIQQVSGHRTLTELQKYLEVSDAQVRGAVSALSMLSYSGKREFPSLGIETVTARSGFGAKLEKQFLFWDLKSKKAIASGCRVGGCGLQGEVRYLKRALEIPKTPTATASSG